MRSVLRRIEGIFNRHTFLRYVPAVVFLLAILVESFRPSQLGDASGLFFYNQDKIFHFIIYQFYAIFVLFALNRDYPKKRIKIPLTLGITSATALIQETIHAILPYRTGDIWDLLFDLLGILVALSIWVAVGLRKK